MILHEIVVVLYRLIVLGVLALTLRAVFDEENDRWFQFTAVVIAIPLVLRLLMIK